MGYVLISSAGACHTFVPRPIFHHQRLRYSSTCCCVYERVFFLAKSLVSFRVRLFWDWSSLTFCIFIIARTSFKILIKRLTYLSLFVRVTLCYILCFNYFLKYFMTETDIFCRWLKFNGHKYSYNRSRYTLCI